MSAEILRRAVVRIYHDVEFGQAHGDDIFLLAVANWLDRTANSAPEFNDSLLAALIRMGDESLSQRTAAALDVAHAYLEGAS